MFTRVQSGAKRLLVNTAATFAGEIVCRGVTFAFTLVIAHRFGLEALGEYGYALSLASIFLLVPDMGTHFFMIREMAIDESRARHLFWQLQWLKVPLALATGMAGLLLGAYAIHSPERRLLFYVLLVRVLFQSFSLGCAAALKAAEQMHVLAALQFTTAVVTLIGLGLCLALRTGVGATTGVLAGAQVIETALAFLIVIRLQKLRPIWRFEAGAASRILFASLPIGLAVILQALNLRVDVLVLGAYASNAELGYFQPAAWFAVGVFLLAALLMTAVFPRLARLMRTPSLSAIDYVESLLRYGLFAMSAFAIVAWIMAPVLIKVLFGSRFAPATLMLRNLAPALPPLFLNTILFHVFIARDLRNQYLIRLVFSTATAALLGCFVAPRWGGAGIAVLDVFRELVLTISLVLFLQQNSILPTYGRLLLGMLSGASLVGILALITASGHSPQPSWVAVVELAVLMLGAILSGPPNRHQIALLLREGA